VSKLLITGASGYLGTALAARAVAGGWEVVGTHLTRAPDAAPGLRAVALDVRDADAVARLVAAEAPDAIIHTAYRMHGDDLDAVNAGGAGHVADVAARAGVRLVHLSTDVVFAGAPGHALTEEDPVGPVHDYGRSKAAAEGAVALADPDALVVRTSLLYGGPGRPPSGHETLALAAARGEQDITFFSDELRCPIQVDDLADALLELVGLDRSGLLHVVGPDAVDRLTFARLAVAARGEDPSALRGGPAPPGRPAALVLDGSRAQALLATPVRGVHQVLG
jgi:dTDP-4-dehydrorhamnose reductase